jgi:hypothetical protein
MYLQLISKRIIPLSAASAPGTPPMGPEIFGPIAAWENGQSYYTLKEVILQLIITVP